MMMDRQLHPIQLDSLQVVELFIKVFDPDAIDTYTESSFKFSSGTNEFDPEDNSIVVGVIGEVGDSEGDKAPFYVKAQVLGRFLVNTDEFPADKIQLWAKQNAPLILIPFIRENIYGLAARAGIKEVIIPTFIVPSFKIEKQSESGQS